MTLDLHIAVLPDTQLRHASFADGVIYTLPLALSGVFVSLFVDDYHIDVKVQVMFGLPTIGCMVRIVVTS